MRDLLATPGDGPTGAPDDLVRRTYDRPGPLVRWNMISTLDGSAVGANNSSDSINNPADHRVFGFLRGWADAVVVGAGTARTEGYTPLRPNRWRSLREGRAAAPLLVVVSTRDELPPALSGAGESQVHLVHGPDVDPPRVISELHALGHDRILLEGGPRLATSFVEAGLVDELCLTIAPTLVGGDGLRITRGPQLSSDARLLSLLEEDGTLLGRWAL